MGAVPKGPLISPEIMCANMLRASKKASLVTVEVSSVYCGTWSDYMPYIEDNTQKEDII